MPGKSDIKAGAAYVELLLRDSKFVKGLRAAGQKLTNFGGGVAKIGAGIEAAGAAIVGPLLGAAKHFADVGSALNDMSARTGISASSLSELGYAADMTGASMEDVEGAVRKMQKFLASAADGSKEARLALRDLGLTIDDLKGMTPDQQFEAIANKIGQISDPTKRAAAAIEIFGKKGTQLRPMIESMSELRAEARELGLVPTDQAVKAADDLGDAFDRVTKTLGALVFNIGGAVAPMVTKAANVIAKIVAQVSKWAQQNSELIQTVFAVGLGIMAAGAAVTALGLAIAGAGVVLSGLATGLAAIGTVLGAVLSPIGLITAALVAGAVIWAKYTESGQNAISGLMGFLEPLLAAFQQTFQGVYDAISSGDLALAGEIALAGLKLVLLKGLAALTAAVGGSAGDVLGSIGGKLISGDFAGAWQDAVTAMAEQWYAFSEGIVAAFTAAASAIKDVWLKVTTAISNAILSVAEQDGYLGDLATKLLGYDDRANAAKTKRMQAAAKAAGIDTLNTDTDGGAQADAANILKGQADSFQSKLDALNAGRQKLTNDARSRTIAQTGGGAAATSDAADAAQAQLDELTNRARAAREAADAANAADANKVAGASDLSTGVKQGVVSTFSAAALLASGGGGVVGELKSLHEEAKKQTKLADKTYNAIKDGGKFS